METSSMNVEQSQMSSSSLLNFCCSLLQSPCTDLFMSQEYHSLPGDVVDYCGSDGGLEMGLPLAPIFQEIQRGGDFPPAETDA